MLCGVEPAGSGAYNQQVLGVGTSMFWGVEPACSGGCNQHVFLGATSMMGGLNQHALWGRMEQGGGSIFEEQR